MKAEHSLLVVEDDLDVAEMLRAYFDSQGYAVRAVNWGEEVLDACLDFKPDLIILDIRLPDIDGYEVARRVRSHRRTKDLPIVFVTEKKERADRLRGLELGADDYVTKPFDVQELRLRVRNALRRGDQPPLINPVTGFPEEVVLQEEFEARVTREALGLLLVRFGGLPQFREKYGFLAADEVLRAVSLMIANTLREHGEPRDMVGHLGVSDFLLLTEASNLHALESALGKRLQEALSYFYPLEDRPDPGQPPPDTILTVQTSSLASTDLPSVDFPEARSRLVGSAEL